MERANETTLNFNLGTFEGFNFRSQSAVPRILSGDDVVNWDHDKMGEAEFWPAGDHALVAAIFSKANVTGTELSALDDLLSEFGRDDSQTLLRIYFAVGICGEDLRQMIEDRLDDYNLHIFIGTNFTDLRKEAAYELFELYYPEAYAMWEKCNCDGLIFDTDRFLDSPSLSTSELRLTDSVALLVNPE